jgi:hypothetical protein
MPALITILYFVKGDFSEEIVGTPDRHKLIIN